MHKKVILLPCVVFAETPGTVKFDSRATDCPRPHEIAFCSLVDRVLMVTKTIRSELALYVVTEKISLIFSGCHKALNISPLFLMNLSQQGIVPCPCGWGQGLFHLAINQLALGLLFFVVKLKCQISYKISHNQICLFVRIITLCFM